MVRQSTRKVKTEAVEVEASLTKTKAAAPKANGKKVAVTESKAVVKKTVSKRKAPAAEEEEEDEHEHAHDSLDEEEEKKAAPKKRKTTKTASKGDGEMPLAERTVVSSLKKAMYIGAHVSGAGGVQNSIVNAKTIGANSFALFLKSQRKWTNPPLADDVKEAFHSMLEEHGYDAGKHILPHGSYLVNLANPDKDMANKAYGNFVDDLKRCDALGIRLYNFHPGSSGGEPMEAATGRIAAQLNKSHKETESVITVIENMCGSGNIVGGKFEELRDIIDKVDDKSRVGVCIDTCHTFAAGYDLRTPEAFKETMAKFDEIVGMKYLKALHLNDSKAPFGSHRDLHANIGTGFLGLQAFHNIMNYEPFQNLPMVLETPIDEKGPDGKSTENKQIWADEIKLLESLIGMDPKDPEMLTKSKELQAKGASERKKVQEQVDKKAAKDGKKGKAGKAKKGSKKKKDDSDEDDSA